MWGRSPSQAGGLLRLLFVWYGSLSDLENAALSQLIRGRGGARTPLPNRGATVCGREPGGRSREFETVTRGNQRRWPSDNRLVHAAPRLSARLAATGRERESQGKVADTASPGCRRAPAAS
jgi:hypothetical protein